MVSLRRQHLYGLNHKERHVKFIEIKDFGAKDIQTNNIMFASGSSGQNTDVIFDNIILILPLLIILLRLIVNTATF